MRLTNLNCLYLNNPNKYSDFILRFQQYLKLSYNNSFPRIFHCSYTRKISARLSHRHHCRRCICKCPQCSTDLKRILSVYNFMFNTVHWNWRALVSIVSWNGNRYMVFQSSRLFRVYFTKTLLCWRNRDNFWNHLKVDSSLLNFEKFVKVSSITNCASYHCNKTHLSAWEISTWNSSTELSSNTSMSEWVNSQL